MFSLVHCDGTKERYLALRDLCCVVRVVLCGPVQVVERTLQRLGAAEHVAQERVELHLAPEPKCTVKAGLHSVPDSVLMPKRA